MDVLDRLPRLDLFPVALPPVNPSPTDPGTVPLPTVDFAQALSLVPADTADAPATVSIAFSPLETFPAALSALSAPLPHEPVPVPVLEVSLPQLAPSLPDVIATVSTAEIIPVLDEPPSQEDAAIPPAGAVRPDAAKPRAIPAGLSQGLTVDPSLRSVLTDQISLQREAEFVPVTTSFIVATFAAVTPPRPIVSPSETTSPDAAPTVDPTATDSDQTDSTVSVSVSPFVTFIIPQPLEVTSAVASPVVSVSQSHIDESHPVVPVESHTLSTDVPVLAPRQSDHAPLTVTARIPAKPQRDRQPSTDHESRPAADGPELRDGDQLQQPATASPALAWLEPVVPTPVPERVQTAVTSPRPPATVENPTTLLDKPAQSNRPEPLPAAAAPRNPTATVTKSKLFTEQVARFHVPETQPDVVEDASAVPVTTPPVAWRPVTPAVTQAPPPRVATSVRVSPPPSQVVTDPVRPPTTSIPSQNEGTHADVVPAESPKVEPQFSSPSPESVPKTAVMLPDNSSVEEGSLQPERRSEETGKRQEEAPIEAAAPTMGRPRTPLVAAPPALDFGNPVPIHETRQVVQRLGDAIGLAQESGQHLSIRVTPPQFGPIVVGVTLHEGVVSARVETHSAHAQQMLTEHLPQLHESLSSRGAVIDRIDIIPVENRTNERPLRGESISAEASTNGWLSSETPGQSGYEPQEAPPRRPPPRLLPTPSVRETATVEPVVGLRPLQLQELNVRV